MFAPGKSRIVIDVSGPFLVDKAFVQKQLSELLEQEDLSRYIL